jgi:hypothetical protein
LIPVIHGTDTRIKPVLLLARAHGLNERIPVSSLLDGRRFLYEVVKLYGNGSD